MEIEKEHTAINTISSVESPKTDAPASSPDAQAAPEKPEEKQLPRTRGLKFFDIFLYPVLTNLVVFLFSVGATYLTSRGKQFDKKSIMGKVAHLFQRRGEESVNWLKRRGMNDEQADMTKMVAFSFIDGSLMAPVVKKFEDKREKIGRAIDHRLGTVPEDDAVYAAEPKQSWLSVLGGRVATFSIVFPTALVLSKAGLNKKLFSDPGKRMGEWLAKKPKVAKFFGKTDLPELFKIGIFELFYTSVCTTGLYFLSRCFSRHLNKVKNGQDATANAGQCGAQETSSANAAPDAAPEKNEKKKATEDLKRRPRADKPQTSFSEKRETAVAGSLSYVGM